MRYDVVPIAGGVCEIQDSLQRLLGTRAERPDRRRIAEKRNELASPHSLLQKPPGSYLPARKIPRFIRLSRVARDIVSCLARRVSKALPEAAAEMRHVAEAPAERDIGYAAPEL